MLGLGCKGIRSEGSSGYYEGVCRLRYLPKNLSAESNRGVMLSSRCKTGRGGSTGSSLVLSVVFCRCTHLVEWGKGTGF